jgi:hypothetical protein
LRAGLSASTVPGPIMKGMAIEPEVCSGLPRIERILLTIHLIYMVLMV